MSSYRHRWSVVATTGAVAAALALTAAPAGAASPAAAARAARSRGPDRGQDAPRHRPRRRRVDRRLRRLRAGLRDPARRRQRGGRRRRRRRGARRHRAVLRRHRRRRLLRLLRRPHHASPRSTAARPRPRAFDAPTSSSTRRPGKPYPFETAVESGPVRRRPGHARHLADRGPAVRHPVGRPAAAARRSGWPTRGFVVDATFREQIAANAARFARFSSTAALYLPGRPAAGGRQHVPQPRPRRHLPAARPQGHRQLLHGPARARDRRDRRSARRWPPGRRTDDPRACITARDIARLPHDPARAHPREVPRAGRVRHGAVVQRRHDGRRGAEHPRERPARAADRAQALHDYLEASRRAFADRNRYIGDPAYLAPPGVLPAAAADAGLRRRALLHHRPDQALPRPGARRARPTATTTRAARRSRTSRPAGGDHEGLSTTHLVDGRPLGQRRLVHADDRADRRQRHGRARPRVPAQQRDDRLQLHAATPGTARPEPARRRASGRAASMSPTIVLRARQAVPGARLARRRDHHHHRAADPDQPARPGHALPEAIAAPRASQRNQPTGAGGGASRAFLDLAGRAGAADPVGRSSR